MRRFVTRARIEPVFLSGFALMLRGHRRLRLFELAVMTVALLGRSTLLRGLTLTFSTSRHRPDLPLASVRINVFSSWRSKSRSGGILLAQAFGDRSIFSEGAWELEQQDET